MDCVAAFGIGSTNFRYVAATPAGEFLTDVRTEPTRPRGLADQLVEAVDDLRAAVDRPIAAATAAVAGLVQADAGAVARFDTPTGETVDRIDLGDRLAAERSLPLYLENDCTAAALGEWYFGARTDERCLVHLTVGTGIGGGVVERGRPLRGESGQAGEFGLLPVAPDSGLESCGIAGAWEAVCSGRGIPAFVRRRLGATDESSRLDPEAGFTAVDVFDAAAAGDPVATACLDRVARYNAAGVGAVCNAVNPGLVTFGGGVALNHDRWLLDGVGEHLGEFCFVDPPSMRVTDLGDDIGLYGAVATYRDREGDDA